MSAPCVGSLAQQPEFSPVVCRERGGVGPLGPGQRPPRETEEADEEAGQHWWLGERAENLLWRSSRQPVEQKRGFENSD